MAVVRWDKSNAELFTRSSVESQLPTFYSYLVSDRVESNRRVVEFMLKIYREIRSLAANSNIDDDRSIDAFLAFLCHAMERDSGNQSRVVRPYVDDGEYGDLLGLLPVHGIEALFEEISDRNSSNLALNLVPSLAIRHAGSEIFQEAHFELLRVPPTDFFGRAEPSETRPVARGGAHFTPPALARTIAEQTLIQLSDIQSRSELTVMDPACGSGAFLHEALRTLRRIGFQGRLVLAGRDNSKAAISMAKFVLGNAVGDWSPDGGCKLDIEECDSLTARLPSADVVLMNPPFLAWKALNSEQRAHMKHVLGDRLFGRGDYCMAFVSRALEALREGGALGTLLPGSLLVLQGADRWRASIAEAARVRFIASLGDYGLFRYAQVQVSAVVLAKMERNGVQEGDIVSLVAGSEAGSTGVALRNLRRAANSTFGELSEHGWHLFKTPSHVFRNRPTWRPILPSTEIALNDLLQTDFIAPVENFFAVRQGARTGMNSVFLRTKAEWEKLPQPERRWFRPASVNESIQDGEVQSTHYIFYPYDEKESLIKDEEELRKELPTYFAKHLQPNKERLLNRASIMRSGRLDWWGLSERRSWALDRSPRIVSKYFGGSGSFAIDLEASFVVVQGFAWIPDWEDDSHDAVDEHATYSDEAVTFNFSMHDLLAAYAAVLNSDIFTRVLRLHSQHVAGGQYDLSSRFVKRIPIPDLPALLRDEQLSALVVELSQLGHKQGTADPMHRHRTERLITELYGSDFVKRI